MAGKLFVVAARARHEHDCDECVLVGLQSGADLYYCPNDTGYLVRRSSDGPDYSFLGLDTIEGLGWDKLKVSQPLMWSAFERHQALIQLLA